MTDDVLQEVRAAREAFAKLHGYDVRAMVAALRQLNAEGDWPVVRLPARPSTLYATLLVEIGVRLVGSVVSDF